MDKGEVTPCAINPHLIMSLFYYVCVRTTIYKIDKVLLAGRNARSCSMCSAPGCGGIAWHAWELTALCR